MLFFLTFCIFLRWIFECSTLMFSPNEISILHKYVDMFNNYQTSMCSSPFSSVLKVTYQVYLTEFLAIIDTFPYFFRSMQISFNARIKTDRERRSEAQSYQRGAVNYEIIREKNKKTFQDKTQKRRFLPLALRRNATFPRPFARSLARVIKSDTRKRKENDSRMMVGSWRSAVVGV